MALTAQQLFCQIFMAFGSAINPDTVFTYTEPIASTGQVRGRISLALPASSVDTAVNLSSYVTNLSHVAIIEKSGNTIAFGPAVGVGTKFGIGANGFVIFKPIAGAPTIYVSNLAASETQIDVFYMGTQV